MTHFADGPNISLAEIAQAVKKFRAQSPPEAIFPVTPKENRYDFMFEDLQKNPANLLEPNSTTAANLIRLGESMLDPDPPDQSGDSRIPSAYTYLGQFIDHDVTRQSFANRPVLGKDTLPLSLDEIRQTSNVRTVGLDLDCLYGPAIEYNISYDVPRDPNHPRWSSP